MVCMRPMTLKFAPSGFAHEGCEFKVTSDFTPDINPELSTYLLKLICE